MVQPTVAYIFFCLHLVPSIIYYSFRDLQHPITSLEQNTIKPPLKRSFIHTLSTPWLLLCSNTHLM